MKLELFYNGLVDATKGIHGFRLRGTGNSKTFKFSAEQLGDYKPESADGAVITVDGNVKVTPDKKVGDTIKRGYVDCLNAKVQVVDYKRGAYVPATKEMSIEDALAADASATDAPFDAE